MNSSPIADVVCFLRRGWWALILGAAILAGMLIATAVGAPSARPPARNEPISLPLKRGTPVTVIAPTRSTSEVARKLVEDHGWIIPRSGYLKKAHAEVALVVVRSSKLNPLANRYEDSRTLRRAANECPNENGPLVHSYVYIYFADEGAYIEIEHSSGKAAEPGKPDKP